MKLCGRDASALDVSGKRSAKEMEEELEKRVKLLQEDYEREYCNCSRNPDVAEAIVEFLEPEDDVVVGVCVMDNSVYGGDDAAYPGMGEDFTSVASLFDDPEAEDPEGDFGYEEEYPSVNRRKVRGLDFG